MKILKYSFGLFASLMLLASCADSVDPNIPYTTFNNGAYLRTIERASTTFNFFDLANSKFEIVVEGVDNEGGNTVETVEVRVRKRRVVPGVGLVYVPVAGPNNVVNDVLVTTLTKADFQPATGTKFLRSTITVPATETLAKLGLTEEDINGGDGFEFRLKLTDKFGRVFNDVNASGDVKGGAFFDSPFLYDVTVVCPTDLAGTYDFVQVGASSPYGNCAGGATSGKTTWTAISGTTSYDISDATYGLFECIGDPPSLGAGVRLSDSCGVLGYSGSDGYGATYTFTFVSNDGSSLVFSWKNSYNEVGTVTVFANPGKPWPATLR